MNDLQTRPETSAAVAGSVQKIRKKSLFREYAEAIIIAVLLALVIRQFAVQAFTIPSGSMIPSLLIGDYLFVSKFSYGYSRFSLPTWLTDLDIFGGRILFREPERGDVAVFKLPRDNKTDYIKRIVGLPGDRIQVKGGILHINGEPVKRERIEDFVDREFASLRATMVKAGMV